MNPESNTSYSYSWMAQEVTLTSNVGVLGDFKGGKFVHRRRHLRGMYWRRVGYIVQHEEYCSVLQWKGDCLNCLSYSLSFFLSFSSDFEEFRNRISHSRSLTDRMLRDSKEHKHVYPAMRGNRRFLHSRIEKLWIGWMQGVIVNFKPFIKSLLIKLICLRGRQIIKWPYRQKFV